MDYIIIGAGPAGVIAAETLRKCDPSGAITLIGNEAEAPYSRMAIPYLLADNIAEEGTHLRHGADHYSGLDIAVRRDRVSKISSTDNRVILEGGETLTYDRLLIATGARATRPPIPGVDLDGIESCWTLDDSRRITAAAESGSKVVLMGAGFIGCIVLEALARRGVDLTVVEMEDRMLPRMMDEIGGDMIKRWCQGKGVTVMTGTKITGIEAAGGGYKLALDGGSSIDADLVVCATGVAPYLDFLDGSGVETDHGILVDSHLETNVAGIYAAGDVAQGPDFSTGKREVHAIQPTAATHGRIAALNMAGQATHYEGSLAMNVLNTLGLVSSSYGLWMGVDGGDRAVISDEDGFKYLRLEFDGDLLVGALALGLTQHVGVLRGLIQTKVRLGPWKERLMANPHLIMDAYLARTQKIA